MRCGRGNEMSAYLPSMRSVRGILRCVEADPKGMTAVKLCRFLTPVKRFVACAYSKACLPSPDRRSLVEFAQALSNPIPP